MAWSIYIGPYNNGANTWTNTQLTDWVSFSIDHTFNTPARCELIVEDVDGTKLIAYNDDTNDVYIGSGKITIGIDGTTQFVGLIQEIIGSTDGRTIRIIAHDYLCTLDTELITYDMREKLSGNIRQSTIRPDYDDTDGEGIAPANENAGTYYVYDSEVGLTADAHNGEKMILTAGMAGSNSWATGPYAQSDSGGLTIDAFDNDIGDLWTYDADNYNSSKGSAYWVNFDFKTWVTDSSAWFTSISGAKITISYTYGSGGFTVQLYNGATYNIIGTLDGGGSAGDDRTIQSFEIPDSLLSSMHDANGECTVRFDTQAGAGGALNIHYLEVELTTITSGYNTKIGITDGETYRLTVDVDLSADATKVWDGLPYCIARPIYKHIASDETPGGLIDDGDVYVTLVATTGIEHTTGYSTKQYTNKTRLEILRDLAAQDKAVFWLNRANVNLLIYRQTFGADTAQLTDAAVESWQSVWNIRSVFNDYHVKGVRIGDYEISQNVQDATSIDKFFPRSKLIRKAGVVSDAHAKDVATAMSARDKDPVQMVQAVISGVSALVLGVVVEITSSYLWSTAAKDYVVYRWTYDSTEHQTIITLHPKSTIGMQEIQMHDTPTNTILQNVTQQLQDTPINDPITHEVA